MPKWEYEAVSWGFFGPHLDDWPDADAYVAARDAVASARHPALIGEPAPWDVSEELWSAWLDWCDAIEREYLAQMGEAGFELVTLHRSVDRAAPPLQPFERVRVRAYFKREAEPEAPPPARPIGYRPPPPAEA